MQLQIRQHCVSLVRVMSGSAYPWNMIWSSMTWKWMKQKVSIDLKAGCGTAGGKAAGNTATHAVLLVLSDAGLTLSLRSCISQATMCTVTSFELPGDSSEDGTFSADKSNFSSFEVGGAGLGALWMSTLETRVIWSLWVFLNVTALKFRSGIEPLVNEASFDLQWSGTEWFLRCGNARDIWGGVTELPCCIGSNTRKNERMPVRGPEYLGRELWNKIWRKRNIFVGLTALGWGTLWSWWSGPTLNQPRGLAGPSHE